MKLAAIAVLLTALGASALYFPFWKDSGTQAEPPAESTSPDLNRSPAALKAGQPPPLAKASGPSPAALKVTEELGSIANCLERRDCNFPHSDEKTYDFAVGQALRSRLMQFKEEVKASQTRSEAITKIAVTYLAAEDGHVQEAALELLSTQPTSSESLDVLLTHVIEGYDAQLIQLALRELARYQSPEDRYRIADVLADAMVTGSPFVAKEISRGIHPFVYEGSLSVMESAMVKLPASSAVRLNLERAIKDVKGA